MLDKIEVIGIFNSFVGIFNSFVSFKENKENFMNHPTTRLIKLSKNEIGRISEHILDQ